MSDYLPILVMSVLVILFVLLSFIASQFLAPQRPNSAKPSRKSRNEVRPVPWTATCARYGRFVAGVTTTAGTAGGATEPSNAIGEWATILRLPPISARSTRSCCSAPPSCC